MSPTSTIITIDVLCLIPPCLLADVAWRWSLPEPGVALEALRSEVTVEELHDELGQHGALAGNTFSAGLGGKFQSLHPSIQLFAFPNAPVARTFKPVPRQLSLWRVATRTSQQAVIEVLDVSITCGSISSPRAWGINRILGSKSWDPINSRYPKIACLC